MYVHHFRALKDETIIGCIVVLEDLMRSAKAYAHETGTERSRDRSPTPEVRAHICLIKY